MRCFRTSLGLAALIALSCTSPTGVDGSAGTQVAMVSLDQTASTVIVGTDVALHAAVMDVNGSVVPNATIVWSVRDADIAGVSAAGVVSGRAVGSTQVAASSGGRSAVASITVQLPPVASVTVQPRAVSLAVGQTTPLATVVTDANGAPAARLVTWSSGNEPVATVSASGVVTALATGQATITATSEGKSDAAVVTVTRAPVGGVVVAPANSALIVGETAALGATVRDSRGIVVTDRPVVWKSSNDLVATVSAAGVVTALSVGSATITATSEGQSGTAIVSVAAVPVGSVSVSPNTANLFVAQIIVLAATVRDANGTVVTDRPVTWKSSNEVVATVSPTGVVTAVAQGSATITASAGPKSGATTIVVTLVPVGSVTVAPATKSLIVGTTTNLGVTVRDANGTIVTNRAVTWSSSDPLVATVSSAGVVTAVAPGPATITATSEGKNGSSAITVTPVPVANVTVQPPTLALMVGQTATVVAVLKDANGNVLTGRVVTWTSNNPAVATVSATGVVTAVAPGGPVFITASSEGWNGSASATVTAVPVASVTLPATTTLVAGQSITLTPVVTDANGTVVTNRVVTWSSSNTNVATVTSAGLVRSLITGSATITATSEGKSGSTALTVTPAAVGSVTLLPSTPTVASGSTVSLAATVKDINGTTVTDRVVTWKSSNALVATVSATGVVTGLAAGTATITATSESKSGTATVTVVPGPAATVTVTPAPASVRDGSTLQLTASAVDANGNAITGRTYIWLSSNTSLATVSTSGRVTGRNPGLVTISATLAPEMKSGVSQVTVTP